MAQIQDLQNKVNSLSNAREFCDPESRSCGATHVPDQTSTILSSRTLPRCDSGLPRNTQNCTGITGNVCERPSAQEGRPSTFFNNSKNLASSSQALGPDTSGTTRRRESEMKREPLNTSMPSPQFQRGGGMLNHNGGTYSHSGMMDYPRLPIWELHLGKFEAAKSTSTLKFVAEQRILRSQCSGSRSILVRTNFPDFDILDATIASALTRLLDKHIQFRKRVGFEEQRAQKFDRFSRGRQIAYMIDEHSGATGACGAVQGL